MKHNILANDNIGTTIDQKLMQRFTPIDQKLEHMFTPIFNLAFVAAISFRPELLVLTEKLQETIHLIMAGKYNRILTRQPITTGNLRENITAYLKILLGDYFEAMLSADKEKIEAETKFLELEINYMKQLEN